jgi:flagellar motor protein MotB
MERGRLLATAKKKAVSLFQPEIKSNKVRITSDERGLVISLASDAFFRPASANINIEETRTMLIRLAELLKSDELEGRKFRIEGHTDESPTDPAGPWFSNWELSSARALNVLHYLTDFGAPEKQVPGGRVRGDRAHSGSERDRGRPRVQPARRHYHTGRRASVNDAGEMLSHERRIRRKTPIS